jgi:hypothetical protein
MPYLIFQIRIIMTNKWLKNITYFTEKTRNEGGYFRGCQVNEQILDIF